MRTSRLRAGAVTVTFAAVTALATAAYALAATGWTAVPVPTSEPSAFLLGASAPSDTNAWAVGSVTSGSSSVGNRPLIEHWDGTAWGQSAAPALSTSVSATLTAVSASSATDAWAVGYTRFNRSTFTTLGFHWNGSAWTNVTSILGFRATIPIGTLDLGPSDAYMIANDSSLASGLLEHWDGSSWSTVTLPDPDPAHPGLNTAFDSIAATSADDVWVIGSHLREFSSTLLRWEPYALHWNGAAWSVVSMPPLPGTDNQLAENLTGLTALAPDDVWAVGGQGDGVIPPGGTPTSTLIEHWDGTAWSVVAAPSPGTDPSLVAAAARSASDIWATGYDTPAGSTVRQTLTEHFDGTSWTVQSSPVVSGGSLFTSVATGPGAGLVWAVGWSGSASTPSVLAAEHN